MAHEDIHEGRYMQAANRLNLLALGEAPGAVWWKPAGFKFYERLRQIARYHHQVRGYQEMKSPSLVNASLFDQSGHSEKYRENMFYVTGSDENVPIALRPMSCPNHIHLYRSEVRSVHALPLRLFEFGEVFRNEASGALQVLFRGRQFCQDDSHVFCAPDQVAGVVAEFIEMGRAVYAELGFADIRYELSLRPELRFGDDEVWDKAENDLREACRANGVEAKEVLGGGAFYGPKLEMHVEDKLGRSWQMGVVQIDYVLPERFDLEYVDADNHQKRPVILHHAVMGSLERMAGVLLEGYGVNLPDNLHPHADVVVAVSNKSSEYAKALAVKKGFDVDVADDPLGKKLERWRAKGVPRIWVVGEQEAQAHTESGAWGAVLNHRDGRREVWVEGDGHKH